MAELPTPMTAMSLPRLAARLLTPSTSSAAAAAMPARTSSEIWIFPSSSQRETYSLFSLMLATLLVRLFGGAVMDMVYFSTLFSR